MELHDPLTYPQVIAYQNAISEVGQLMENGNKPSLQQLHFALLPGILECVSKWNLKHIPKKVTIKNFPATPTVRAGELMDWLREEVFFLMSDIKEVPNE